MHLPWPFFVKTRRRQVEAEAQEDETDRLKKTLAELRGQLLDKALKDAKGVSDDR